MFIQTHTMFSKCNIIIYIQICKQHYYHLSILKCSKWYKHWNFVVFNDIIEGLNPSLLPISLDDDASQSIVLLDDYLVESLPY